MAMARNKLLGFILVLCLCGGALILFAKEVQAEPTGSLELSESIEEILVETSNLMAATDGDADALLAKIDSAEAAYNELSSEEQELLSGSLEALENAASAVELAADVDGAALSGNEVEQPGVENSFRYINGQPIQMALDAISLERLAVSAEGDLSYEEQLEMVAEAAPDVQILTAGSGNKYVLGVDISRWNGTVDWTKMKAAGIKFAIIRCGSTNTSKQLYIDPYFDQNAKECERLGIPYGAYLYSYALDQKYVQKEIALALKALKGHKLSLPVFYDVEDKTQANLSPAAFSNMIDYYCSEIQRAGYAAGIYSMQSWFEGHLGPVVNNPDYYHWVAQWPREEVTENSTCAYKGRLECWQYTAEGELDGAGIVDLNRWYGSLKVQVTKTKPHTGVPMYRMYNPNSSEHFYTASIAERENLVSLGWNYEGIGWYAPKKSGTPVYRLYNANAGDHHYTSSLGERNHLIKLGWRDEGIGWYSDDAKGVALYRQYNPNAVAGSHNYTTSKGENDYLVKLGWRAEGIGWYGVK